MNNITLAAAALLTLSSWSFAAGGFLPVTDKDFAHTINEAILPFQAKDAFARVGACSVVDAATLRPVSLDEATAMLKPCLEGLSAAYGTDLSLKIEAESLVIETGLTTVSSPLLRDLGYALQNRRNHLLGHPVKISRGFVPVRQSRVQAMIDGCMKTMVIRSIESGADFLNVYGGCLNQERSIKSVLPSAGHKLGLTVLAAGEQPEVESLNGLVTVKALNGLVELLVVAYPEKIALP